MSKIFKYKIDPPFTEQVAIRIDMPFGAKIISAKEQHDRIVLYAIVHEDTFLSPHFVKVIPTGVDFHPDNLWFIDTVRMYEGEEMYHVFEIMTSHTVRQIQEPPEEVDPAQL